MKIQINRKLFADALFDIMPLTGRNKVLPILSSIKVVTKGNKMRLQASDAENTIRKYVTAEFIEGEGEFLTDGRSLANLLRSLQDDSITIVVDEAQLTVVHSKGKAQVAVQDADKYPDTAKITDSKKFTLPCSAILSAIEDCRNFVSDEDLRPHLKHIYACVSGGTFIYSATDTRKLIVNKVAVETGEMDCEWYISTIATSMIQKACINHESVEIEVNDSYASYRIGDTIIYTQLPNGKYPPYQRVIPSNNPIKCVVSKAELSDSIKRCQMFADEIQLMRFNLSNGEIGLTTDNYAKGKTIKETIPADCDARLIIGFKADHFLDCLSAYKNEKATMTFSDTQHPVLLLDENEPDKRIILMPVVLNG